MSACAPKRASARVRLSSHSVSSVASKNGGNGGSVRRRLGRGFAARLESRPERAGICCGQHQTVRRLLCVPATLTKAAWGRVP